jgi:hypothetical protein
LSGSANGGSRVKRLFTESAVIIASILVAFAIDASWEQANERAQETALRGSLLVDFEGARADLDRVLAMHDSIISAADRLMQVSRPQALAAADAETLIDAFGWLLAVPTFDPPTGTVEALLSSGRVDIIRDEALVREFTRWSAIVQDLQEDEVRANDHVSQVLYPMLLTDLNLKDVGAGPFPWPGRKDPAGPFDIVLEDRVQSALYRHWSLHNQVSRNAGPAVAVAIDRVIELLKGGE